LENNAYFLHYPLSLKALSDPAERFSWFCSVVCIFISDHSDYKEDLATTSKPATKKLVAFLRAGNSGTIFSHPRGI
jgi:hypothetical protein